MNKLKHVQYNNAATKPYFDIGQNVGEIIKIYFNGYVDGDILYKIMKFAHIDGFSHRGGKTTMEIEEKWDTQTDI